MVKNRRRQIVWLSIAFFTIAANSLAQGFEYADYEVVDTPGSIDIGQYPAQVPAVMTLLASNHSTMAYRRLAATPVAVVSFSGPATSGRIQRDSDELQCAPANNAIAVAGELMLIENNPPSTLPVPCRNAIMLIETPPNTPAKAMTWTW